MQSVLLVIQFIIAVALIAIILIQRTGQDGGGLMGGGGTMGGLFTARGSANLLTHFTKWLAVAFIVNSLALGYIAARMHPHQNQTMLDQLAPVAPPNPGPAQNSLQMTPVPPKEDSSTGAPATGPDAAKAPAVPVAH